MKRNALRKDFFMEIRKSIGRFLSIFLIVSLGVAILVGIRATKPDMVLSGDVYADENRLMDIKIVSTYGLTETDVDVIENLPAIESVEGTYSVDVLLEVDSFEKVIHVMAKTSTMNDVNVVEGRMPKAEDECLLDANFIKDTAFEIGDQITFQSGTENDLTDTLKEETFTIVGTGSSPLYFSTGRGSSTIGNGSVSGFAIVAEDAFDLEVYTEIYAMAKRAKDAMAFSDEYDTIVEEAIEQIQLVSNARCEVRKNELANQAQLQIDDARSELNAKKEEAEAEIESNEDKLNDAETELQIGKVQIESSKAQLEAAKQELEAGKKELESTRQAYDQVMNPLKDQKEKLEEKIEEWEQQLEDSDLFGKEYLQSAIESMKESIKTLEEEIGSVVEEFEAELEENELRIEEAEAEIRENEALLSEAERELEAGESELTAGKEELENAKNEMESEIGDAEAEIQDAEDEISKIELPTWYIFDRSSVPEYSGYGANADRIEALALVFPSIFFLVAALISLTTMTRMVEEQRVQIGTLKALGYSKFAIVKKYLNYALLATLGGSILGVILGETVLPYIIIGAYRDTVYTYIAEIQLKFQLGCALFGTVLAVFCTGAATIFACYKELMAEPAVLMRPEAPKIGKRTLIERIPFLWKHLNFSWKSSLRNLFRYKKRFFMTLFGIGGCMGLLMVGYGLRDSISSIAAYQYGNLHLYDSSVYFNDTMEQEELEEMQDYLSDNKDVTGFIGARMESLVAKNEKKRVDIYLTVLEDTEERKDYFVFRDRKSKEEYELPEDGVILAEKTADMLDVEVGDSILLSEEGKSEYKVKVAAITENYVSHYVYMTEYVYEDVFEKEPVFNNLYIKVADGFALTELEKIGTKILEYEDVLNVQYVENTVEHLNSMLSALDRVMIVLIIIAGLLSFVVLYNLNNINITERRRELATLKVLGFYDLEVANYVYRENIMLTILGTLVGCVMGKFLHLFTIVTVEVDAAMFGRDIFLNSYLICALFTIGFSAFVNWIMYFKLKKINMVESLKSVE